MTLFFSLLPVYLFGNLHCMGMCGPLVMLLGQHRFRFLYFFGRLFSFSLAGFLAGELGAVLHLFLKQYFLSEIISFICGLFILGWGFQKLIGWPKKIFGKTKFLSLNFIHRWISTFIQKDHGWYIFLFGFFTIALPCGQTMIVFSACALAGDAWVGLGNGFAFALLTSPSLILSMHTLSFFKRFKHYDRIIVGVCSIVVGTLACCRGLAEMGFISHCVLNSSSQNPFHLVIF